jgi:hypothetical protein
MEFLLPNPPFCGSPQWLLPRSHWYSAPDVSSGRFFVALGPIRRLAGQLQPLAPDREQVLGNARWFSPMRASVPRGPACLASALVASAQRRLQLARYLRR